MVTKSRSLLVLHANKIMYKRHIFSIITGSILCIHVRLFHCVSGVSHLFVDMVADFKIKPFLLVCLKPNLKLGNTAIISMYKFLAQIQIF